MKQRITALILMLSIFSACNSLKPIHSEYNLVRTSTNPEAYKYGNGKILIYNGAGNFHKVDDTAALNVWINGKALGQLRSNEFAVLYLMPDTYQFKIRHKDVVNFESVHTVKIDNKTSVINIAPTLTSNKIDTVNTIPPDFRWYKNVLQ